MVTIRQQIIDLLEQDDHDARELSQLLRISEKEVYDHIPSVEKTAGANGKKLKTIPSACLACGYEFKKRERPERPTKCPLCKSERIKKPRFSIK